MGKRTPPPNNRYTSLYNWTPKTKVPEHLKQTLTFDINSTPIWNKNENVVQLLNCVRLSETPCAAAHQAFLSFSISQNLLKLMSIEAVMLSILSSVTPFSFCLKSFPASGSFSVSQFFTSGGQSARASASASVLPMNVQGWFPSGLTGLISLQSKGLMSDQVSESFSLASILAEQCVLYQEGPWVRMIGQTQSGN